MFTFLDRERCSKSKMESSPVSSVNCKKQGKLSIPTDEIINVIAKLEEKITELDGDGKWRSPNSL